MNSILAEPLRNDTLAFLVFILAGAITTMIISVTKIVSDRITRTKQAQLDAALKQQMIAAGMSADEMIRILNHHAAPHGPGSPLACEVVVERDGEWTTALMLNVDENRCYVHYVGEDMSSNEWVPATRVRFQDQAPPSRTNPWESMTASNGVHSKPQPLQTEL